MLKILRRRQLLWHNAFARMPVAVTDFTLPPFEAPPQRLDRVALALKAAFLDRDAPAPRREAHAVVRWAAEAASHLVDPVEPAAGILAQTAETPAMIWTAYRDHATAQLPGDFGLAVLAMLAHPTDLSERVLTERMAQAVKQLEQHMPHYSTRVIAQRAFAAGMPWRRLSKHSDVVSVGHGARQTYLRLSAPENQPLLASKISLEKATSLEMIAMAGLPAGQPAVVRSLETALRAAEKIGYPVAVKPVGSTQGIGVTAKINGAEDLRPVIEELLTKRRSVLVQKHFEGETYRMMLVGGKLISTFRVDLPSVEGDGVSSVAQLIERLNTDPRRRGTNLSMLYPLRIGPDMHYTLREQGYAIEDVLPLGTRVLLSRIGNRHSGGIPVDVTEKVHPENRLMGERAAAICHVRVGSVDLVSPDIARPWQEVGGGICELNAYSGLQVHDIAHPELDLPGKILSYAMQGKGTGRVPTAMVTGNVGKSGTCFLLREILRAAGACVGLASTDGVFIGETRVMTGDRAGASGGNIVLQDPDVTAAVLETARGGIIRRGLVTDRCDVGALLNIGDDHLGQDGVETIDQILAVKRKVTDAAKSAVVLNFDDPVLVRLAAEYPAARQIGFAMSGRGEALERLLAAGGRAVIRQPDGMIALAEGARAQPIHSLHEIAGSYGGANHAVAENALAAAALAIGLGVAPEHISRGLAEMPEPEAGKGGRLVSFDHGELRVVLDRGATVKSLPNIGRVLAATAPGRRRVMLVSVNSFRSDDYLRRFAEGLLPIADRVICYERPSFMRHNGPGELAERLGAAFRGAGAEADRLSVIAEPEAALGHAKGMLLPGDVLMLLGGDADYLTELFEAVFGPRQAQQDGAAPVPEDRGLARG